jgi:hypothetical protein
MYYATNTRRTKIKILFWTTAFFIAISQPTYSQSTCTEFGGVVNIPFRSTLQYAFPFTYSAGIVPDANLIVHTNATAGTISVEPDLVAPVGNPATLIIRPERELLM